MLRLLSFTLSVAFLGVTLSLELQAEPVIGPQLVVPHEVSPGKLLLADLGCVSCHPSPSGAGNLPSPQAPVLGREGLRITPQYLRKYLAEPASFKPGTTMPDVLHHLDGPEKTESVEALVHFLISEQPPGSAQSTGAEESLIRKGRTLYHTVGCVACHAPFVAPAAVPGLTPEDPALEEFDPSLKYPASVPLGDLARKTTVDQLAQFLINPLKTRPSGRMPSLNLTSAEATSIAIYLLREQAPALRDPSKRALIAGLKYQYYEENFGPDPDFETFTAKSTGTATTFDLSPRQREQLFGFRFSGYLRIPSDGRYRFFVTSDDGARLYIDGKMVVDNGGEHAPQEKRGSVELKAGEHSLVVTFHNNGAGYELKVAWQPPEGAREPIPSNLLSHFGQPMVPVDQSEFAVVPEKAARGRELFASLGCAACHSGTGAGVYYHRSKSLAQLGQSANGCLAEKPTSAAPDFHLSEKQRTELKAALANQSELARIPVPAEYIRLAMAQQNCYACHTRDGKGGPVNARLDYFRTSGEIDLGDEGRIPPHLTRVGAKLQTSWMKEVLVNRGSVRPYMATRMPQFGERNVGHLPALFEQTDLANNVTAEPEGSLRDAKFGRRLVGSGGLSCIACHTFAGYKSLGIPAIDLATMTKRLRYDWFHRYVIDPASLRPGTRMPSFWPEGEAVNKEILDGKTDAQIAAIWTYLASKPETDLPPGLVQGKKEIVAETEPVVYRNFIAGAGTRAIGVGYPEKVNLAFDANQMCLAMIWQGPFIDGARHSSGRGEGFEPPLGNNVLNLPQGPPFAVLPNTESAWPTTAGKEGGYQMGGYELNERRQPAFFYSFNGVRVEERFEPVMGEVDAFLKRTIRLTGENRDNLWFRAAIGEIVEKSGNYVLNGKVVMKFPDARPLLRVSGSQSELIVPVRGSGPEAVIVEEIIW